ncbi:MAG: adenosylcobalamin-dependent ribonucleoside-diphosphate reductase [Methanosarcinaceae archaeon]|nr:adenosylcobalamin-dependent ribonucleoside-diphosphate reductase [Methanosarcinaceae archaeon]
MPGNAKGRDALTLELLKARYFRKDEKSWEDLCERVARAIAENEAEYKKFKELMVRKAFVPSTPTIMNAGTDLGQLSACFVVPVGDSVEEIFEALKVAALIQKTGGGTGFNFSKIRPRGSSVRATDGVASGPVAFIRLFNVATDVIKQLGKRRGANMGILEIDHDDIIPFIRAKSVEGEFSNFNFSVLVPDSFMEAVEAGRTGEIRNRRTGAKVGELFSEIVEGIWKNGEPGILFRDRINRDNSTPLLGEIMATNPCGEEPLLDNESCNLASLNLSAFVKKGVEGEGNGNGKEERNGKEGGNGKENRKERGKREGNEKEKENVEVDLEVLRDAARAGIRFLDNEIDKNHYPTPKIKKATLRTRKVGLGVMGFHDLLLKLKIPYASEKALELAEELMKNINEAAILESRALAAEKGPFPEYERSVWKFPMRNATLTAIAPTGTISLLAGCSSGIEPVFNWVYRRSKTFGKEFLIIHPLFEAHFRKKLSSEDYSGLVKHVYENGTLQDLKISGFVNEEEKELFRSALDLGWKAHIDMQAAFQRHCHAGISKTINMPNEATKEDIGQALLYAWNRGLKGLTIYRTGTRQKVVLNLKGKNL